MAEEGFIAVIAFAVMVNAVITVLYEELLRVLFAMKKPDKVHPNDNKPSQ